MGNDNEIQINKTKDEYVVTEVYERSQSFPIEYCKTLEEAVRVANKYLTENEVEYGLGINLDDEENEYITGTTY